MHHLATGLVLVAIGAIFLLGNMGYLDVRQVFVYWPLILIFFGVVRIVESRDNYSHSRSTVCRRQHHGSSTSRTEFGCCRCDSKSDKYPSR